MKLIVCLDDKQGMLFNRRRQSQDAIQRAHMLGVVGNAVLRMNGYSAKLFGEELPSNVAVNENFLDLATSADYCFVENENILPYLNSITEVVVYRWNKTYPSSVTFPLILTRWTKKATAEFPGSSHDKITMEVYTK